MDPTRITYRRILCPVDFSECSRRAFYVAVGYARLFKARLTILHVVERNLALGGYDEVEEQSDLVTRLEMGLRRRLDELQADGAVTVEDRDLMDLEISGGRPFEEILRYTSEHDVDLIVLGTHGHTGIKRVLIGSQAERVLRRAPCHVLAVKPPDYEADIPATRD